MPLTTKDALLERMVDATSALKDNITMLAPAGCVMAFAGSTTPDGWLLCDGSAISRTDYADLYAVIGDTYGAGDGTTTFNLPDLADRFIQGNSTAGTVKTAGLPNIKGGTNSAICVIKADKTADETWSGSIGVGASYLSTVEQNASSTRGFNSMRFDASKSSSVYSDSVTTVQPPALTMRYIIKF